MSASTRLVLFRIGAERFAAPASQVVRIGLARDLGEVLVPETTLGEAPAAGHGLVVARLEGGVGALAVDAVLGLREVPAPEMRPLPALAERCLRTAAIVGVALLDEVPVPVVDIPTLLLERTAAGEPFEGADHA